jgi:hypothetical protein
MMNAKYFRKAVTHMNKWIFLCSFIMVMTMSSNSLASGSGTLTVTCKYFDDNRVEQPLSGAYVYLHGGSKKPHEDGAFNKPSYVLGPSDSSGRITGSVSEGSYRIRITKRDPQNGNRNKFGPPEAMDYTWSQPNPVKIRANVTTDLGIAYAGFFTAPISLTGTVTRTSGDPAADLDVRAYSEPCYSNGGDGDVNQCNTAKLITRKSTDANGQYTLTLRDTGTYYIYVNSCGRGGSKSGTSPCVSEYGGMVSLSLGETKALNIVTYQ